METLRQKHSNLVSELELMLSDIAQKFAPLPEERLMAVVHALLHRCYRNPLATHADVPAALQRELGNVCKACFNGERDPRNTAFVREYKAAFERDLDPDSPTFPLTLAELAEKLKYWEGVLVSNAEDRLPAVLKLEEESRHLREWNVLDVEMPGQYFGDKEVVMDQAVKIERIGADVTIVRRHSSSNRRLTFHGSDGSVRHFVVQTSLTPSCKSDERMVQLFRTMNVHLAKHKEARRRNLAFHAPLIVPVWPQVRLVEDDLAYTSLGEVYEISCARFGRQPDQPIQYFKESLNDLLLQAVPQEEAIAARRLLIYNEITNQSEKQNAAGGLALHYVAESVLSQYLYKILPSASALWVMKKQLAAQLALTSTVAYTLKLGGRAPNRILFAKNSGKMMQTDFHPNYDPSGMVEGVESVPFRLTRNLQTFLSQCGTDGLFVPAMASTAQALVGRGGDAGGVFEQQLALYFRDELISWASRRQPGIPPQQSLTPLPTAELKAKVSLNTAATWHRINVLAPQTYLAAQGGEEAEEGGSSVHEGVTMLVEEAMRPKNLCMMDPTWHPWF